VNYHVRVFLDRFEVAEALAGAPEAGELYRAFDPERLQPVSLRVLPAGPYEVPAVDHPCVRRVLNSFEADGRRVLVEEWVEGETLDRVIERAEPVPLGERSTWLRCLAGALVAAHEAGVVHGSVAPGWVVVSEDGEPKLAGLGTGPLLGREDADPEDDAFAFGLLAYELLTGRLPFPGVDLAETRRRIDAGEPFDGVAELVPDGPPDVATAIVTCLVSEADRLAGLVALGGRDEPSVSAPEPSGNRELTGGSPPAYGGSPAATPLHDDNVQFTVYRPRSVPSEHWSRLLFFAHLDALPVDAEEGEADPVERVEETARQLLGDEVRSYRDSVQDSRKALPREGEITVVPEMDGVRFNPPSATFLWLESVHWQEFRLKPERRLSASVARGLIVVRHGAILLGEIPLRIAVDRPEAADAADPVPSERETGRPYRSIFPSYSHRDTAIVQQFERYVETFGDAYLRDVTTLRSGEIWNDRLMELIEDADVFQLFWSKNSIGSPYVEQEWRHALGLGRPNFVRPVYWEDPLPEDPERGLPTAELRKLHFHLLGEEDDGRAREGTRGGKGGLPVARLPPKPASEPGGAGPRPSPAPEAPSGEFTFSGGRSPGRGWVAAAGVVLVACLALVTYFQVAGPSGGPIDLGSEDAPVATVPVLARGGEESLDLSADQLREIREALAVSPEVEIVIAGHAAEAGRSDEVNLALGEARATAVRDRLIELGVPSDRVFTVSYGEERPVCTEETDECRERNERVEVVAHAPGPRGAAHDPDRDRPNG
jgi:serine/threonine protein kinase